VKPFYVDDIRMTKEELTRHREAMIVLRDAAMRASMLDWSFQISLVIAILARVIEQVEE
jgi:hypothetical protein